ncbi:MAG: hypothetical protein ACT4OP_05120 [Actinomycetota bacterium]
MKQPAYYTATGSLGGDLLAVLHLPYTFWHLSYVALGAALVVEVDWQRLAGTLLAFFCGTGVLAHALDEIHDRPLGTGLPRAALWAMVAVGLAGAVVLAIAGAMIVSPWVLAWGAAGLLLATSYALEWSPVIHTDLGFGLAWGAFPALVGYWTQAEDMSVAALVVAAVATLLSLAQRSLSTPARMVRRQVDRAEVIFQTRGEIDKWGEDRLLATWELPLRLLSWSMVGLAIGLLVARI